MHFKDLPEHIVEYIALYLDFNDLISFGSCSKTQYKSIWNNESFWERYFYSKSTTDFGDIFQLYDTFVNSTGLMLPSNLTKKFGKSPENWREYYVTKSKSIKEIDDDILLEQGNKEYHEAKQLLDNLQDDLNYAILTRLACKMFWVLDVFPGHAGGYYILASILLILNQMDDALFVLDMGHLVDPSFESFYELEEEIFEKLNSNQQQEEIPLIINENLSPRLFNILHELFHKFDNDKDECLNKEELDYFVYSTNGQHPSEVFMQQMARFGANSQGWLTIEGFMAFFLQQTLHDPLETKKDIRMHGYDWDQLV